MKSILHSRSGGHQHWMVAIILPLFFSLHLQAAAPPAPAAVRASDGTYTDKIRVTWSAVLRANGYVVWRNTTTNLQGATRIGSTAGTAFNDTQVVPGRVYWYAVRATNATGASAFSAPDSGYVGLLQPPSGLSTIDGSRSQPIIVKWVAVTGATAYEVWRSPTVTLTAMPAQGYRFVAWNGDASGTINPTTLTMNGNKAVMANFSPTSLAPVPDFNGDGQVDLLLQHSDGWIATWLMYGSDWLSGQYLNPRRLGTGWLLKGCGDFNGDGEADLLLQHADGRLAIWFLDGLNLVRGEYLVPANPGADWQAVGLGDFNGDGQLDLLLQRTDGYLGVWLLNGSRLAEGRYLNPSRISDVNWRVVGVEDISRNGTKDGKPDLLWQHQVDGQLAVWFMDGVAMVEASYVQPSRPGIPAFKVVAVADFDGDTQADLMFDNGSTLAIWYLDGVLFKRGEYLPLNPTGVGWKVVAPR
jgi:hypothetical protein